MNRLLPSSEIEFLLTFTSKKRSETVLVKIDSDRVAELQGTDLWAAHKS